MQHNDKRCSIRNLFFSLCCIVSNGKGVADGANDPEDKGNNVVETSVTINRNDISSETSWIFIKIDV